MTSGCKRIITVATEAEFKLAEFYKKIWRRARKVPLSRRKWLDAISHCFLREGIRIVDDRGDPFSLPDVDDVFGDDPDMRWMSCYLRTDGTGKEPYHHARRFRRLQLIHLYLEIEHPETSFPA